MNRQLRAVVLLVMLPVLAQPTAAQAAVPKRAPDEVLPCSDGKGVVKVWDSRGRQAMKNGCESEWVQIWRNGWDSGASKAVVTNLAPGAHFNWKGSLHDIEGVQSVGYRLEPRPRTCTPETAWVISKGSHGKAVELPCPEDA